MPPGIIGGKPRLFMKSPKPLIGYENVTYASVTYATVGWVISHQIVGFWRINLRNSRVLADFPQVPVISPTNRMYLDRIFSETISTTITPA
jgi:hypothetical protein